MEVEGEGLEAEAEHSDRQLEHPGKELSVPPHSLLQVQEAIYLSVSLVGIPLLWVVGTVGNALSAAVFYRQGLHSRINLCLFWLALADLLSVSILFAMSAEEAYRILVGPAHFFITYAMGLC